MGDDRGRCSVRFHQRFPRHRQRDRHVDLNSRPLASRSSRALGRLNLVGAVVTVAFFQAKVSNTIASTLAIKPGLVVVMSALIGAISWNLITWYRGLPSSSTHALIGGLCGAGIAAA